jgi:heptosyltransferase II
MHQPKHILVRTPNWIGDHVMAYSFYTALRAHYSRAHIIFLTSSVLASYDDTAVCDEKISNVSPQSLRARAIDLAITLPASISSAVFLFRTGARERTGYAEPLAELFLTSFRRWQGRKTGKHKAELYRELFEHITGTKFPIEKRLPLIAWPRDKRDRIVVAPGASIELREWPYYEHLLKELRRLHPQSEILVVGNDPKWKKLPIFTTNERVQDCIGQTDLKQLVEILSTSKLTIANDSGTAHLAATVAGCPTLVLFGPGDPEYIRPEGENVLVARLEGLRCSPCEKPYCRAPYGYKVCLERLTLATVLEKAERLLSL